MPYISHFFLPVWLLMYEVSALERIFLPKQSTNFKPITYDGLDPYLEFMPSSCAAPADVALLICPGGGYQRLSYEKEGLHPAQFYSEHCMDTFILSYSLRSPYPSQYNDANNALDIIRARPSNYKKIGILGFSAGGHLAATISTLNTAVNGKVVPDFCFLLYPVITMDERYVHTGSKKTLMGAGLHADLEALLSAEKQVRKGVPPTVLIHSMDDTVVPIENSFMYLSSLKEHGISATAQFYDHGGHGFGIGYERQTSLLDNMLRTWPHYTLQFLQSIGYLPIP